MSSRASAESPDTDRGVALARATVCLAATIAFYLLAVWTPSGQILDSGLMGLGFAPLPRPIEALELLRKGSLPVLAGLAIVAGASALRRRRWGLLLRSAVLTGISVGASTLARRLLPRPDLGDPIYPFNTWPSGHVAASAALIVSAFVLAPAGWQTPWTRRVAAVTLVVVAGASVATLAHRPSDVLSAMLWVATLTAMLFRSGPLGWRALRGDLLTAIVFVVVAVTFLFTPGFGDLGVIANGAWLVAASLMTIGWRGEAPATGTGSARPPET